MEEIAQLKQEVQEVRNTLLEVMKRVEQLLEISNTFQTSIHEGFKLLNERINDIDKRLSAL